MALVVVPGDDAEDDDDDDEEDEVDINEMLLLQLLVFCPQFEGLAGITLGFGGKGGGTDPETGRVSPSINSFIELLVKDNLGAGIGLLESFLMGLKLARTFLSLLAALKCSPFFRKSGNSKLISTPR